MRYSLLPALAACLTLSSPLVVADTAAVKEQVSQALPNVKIHAVRPTTLPGFYEVEAENQLVYVSTDGKYLLLGDVVDLRTRTNLTEAWREQSAARLLDEIGEQNMIVIGPANAKRTVTVFTDVDCPYCQKLHREVPELNKAGVKVRYLLFPRGGNQSPTYRRSVAVWCAADRAKAIGVAKGGGKLDMKTCQHPVDNHYQAGQRLGISGTPTIFLDDGKKLGGYVPAKQLLGILDLGGPPAVSHAR